MSPALSPKQPRGSEWTRLPDMQAPGRLLVEVWVSGPIRVTSSLSSMELPDGSGELGPQWLIGISANSKRPKPHHVRRALRAFGMTEAEEDNHEPGVARKFFLVVDPTRRTDCECKETEETVVEPDGFTWQNPKPDAGPCRGCEYERLSGRPCPIHTTKVASPTAAGAGR